MICTSTLGLVLSAMNEIARIRAALVTSRPVRASALTTAWSVSADAVVFLAQA